jgi:DNA-directed RNA polymerase subunit RPC12/RpoP
MSDHPKASVSAQWLVSLLSECPKCKQDVDLLDYAEFWDGRDIDIPEHGTERSDNLEVVCPECGHEFAVSCEW